MDYYDIEPFMISFKKIFDDTDVKLVVHVSDKISAWTKFQLANSYKNIELIDIPAELNDRYFGYQRFYMIEQYLKEHRGECGQVLMADMRDVIFQDNPFEHYRQYSSYLVYATEYVKIKNQTDNTAWIKRHFGEQVLNRFNSHAIVCAGTLMGTADALEFAYREMNKYLEQDSFNIHGADQATLNYFIYTEKLKPAIEIIMENNIETGVICTNGWLETPIKDDKILTPEGQTPAVVHQYDHHKSMKTLVDKLYRTGKVAVTEQFKDFNSLTDMATFFLGEGNLAQALNCATVAIESNNTPADWNPFLYDRIYKSLTHLVNSTPPQSFVAELLEQAFCCILVRSFGTNVTMQKIYMLNFVVSALQARNHVIYKPLLKLFGDLLWQCALAANRNGNVPATLSALKRMQEIDYPLTGDYYLLLSKNYRLAGGLGTRIGEESQFVPKPMIEIGGKPILWHIMKLYSHWGYNDFVICAGYKQHLIKDYFARYMLYNSDITFDFTDDKKIIVHKNLTEPWRITIVNTGYETLTAWRIKKIQPYIGNENFLLTYGDGVSTVNVNELIKFHKSHGKVCTITAVQPEGRFGAITLDGDKVLSFREKSKADVPFINGGYMVMRPEIFDYIEGDFMLEQEPMDKLIAAGEVRAYKYDGFWQCMDTIRDKHKLQTLWDSGKAPWKLWEEKFDE